MTLLGKFKFTTGAQNPTLSAYLGADNGVGDYYSFDYTAFEPSTFSGICYGSLFIKDGPTNNLTTKTLLSFSGGAHVLEIRQNHGAAGTYTLEFDLNGLTFITPVFPASGDWRWFYFYCDFVNGTGYLYLNGSEVVFDSLPVGGAVPPASMDNVFFIQDATYDEGQRFGRFYVDFDTTVTPDEFLSFQQRFARNDGTLIVSKDLGEFGQIGTGNIPCLYMKLTVSVHLDSRGEELTPVGAPSVLFDNVAPIIIAL